MMEGSVLQEDVTGIHMHLLMISSKYLKKNGQNEKGVDNSISIPGKLIPLS